MEKTDKSNTSAMSIPVAFSKERLEPGRVKREGAVFYVRYLDHVLFKNVDPGAFSVPFIRETIGWLENENDNSIQIVWERFAGANSHEGIRQKVTGLVILKSCIQELRYLGKDGISQHDAYKEKCHVADISRDQAAPSRVRAKKRDLRSSNKPIIGRGGEV